MKRTETKADERSASSSSGDEQLAKIHYKCNRCHPEWYLGVPAICGEKLLGIKHPGKVPECKDCQALYLTHVHKDGVTE